MENRRNKGTDSGKNNFSTTPNRYEPSAFESEILPLHKPRVYDKGFRPPEALRGLAKREVVMTWCGILL